jgi:MOSC domain-containing protein YiiM
LIAAEDLAAIAAFLGRSVIAPELLRRNIVTSGINLLALKDRRVRLGAALLEISGDCAPCSRMEHVPAPAVKTPCAAMAASRCGS